MNLLWHIYDVSIAPIALYGAEVWARDAQEKVLNPIDGKYVRRVLNLSRGTPLPPILLDTDRCMTVYWKSKLRMLSYWLRLRKLPASRLAKIAYNAQREMQVQGYACWGKEVFDLLNLVGKGNSWISDVVENGPMLKKQLETGMKSLAENQFKKACLEKPSLNIYRECNDAACKIERVPRKYVRVVLSSRYRLPILVERVTQDGTGLWRCKLCKEIVNDKWLHMFYDCREANQMSNRVDGAEVNSHKALFFSSSVLDNVKVAKRIIQFENLIKRNNERKP